MMYLKVLTLAISINLVVCSFSFESRRRIVLEKEIDMDYARRTESIDMDEEVNLQGIWWNWNFCTVAYPKQSFIPAEGDLVPDGYVFLAGFPSQTIDENSTECNPTITRTGNITAGKKTVFTPVVNTAYFDAEDDWILGRENCSSSLAAVDAARYGIILDTYNQFTNASFKANLLSTIDGDAVAPKLIYNGSPYYSPGCIGSDVNKSYEEYLTTLYQLFKVEASEGDACDAEPWEPIKGLDNYPLLGWWIVDTREWAVGDVHTYEFGSKDFCIYAKYVLTAVEAPEEEEEENGGFFARLWNRIISFFENLFG